jgi:hypothetical protein
MASTYVNDLRLNEMATGDASGSWGTVTNTNLELIGEAFSYGTETIGDADSTLTIADGAADAARSFYLKITSSVDLTTTRIVTLGPNTVSKVWMIENATTGSQVITIKQGSGATINVPNGQVKMISTDGAGSGGAVLDLLVDVDLTGTTTLVNLDVSGAVDIAGDLTLSAGGDGALRFTAASSVKVLDNNAAALVFEEADNAYMTFVTTDGSEAVKFDKALDINAATQIDATVTVGVDDTGYDVKFFGATAGAYMLWDESADDLILGGAAGLSVNSTALVTGVLTTTAATVHTGGITMPDNAKAIFGAGSDLEIYSDGTNIIIEGQNLDSEIQILSDDRVIIGSKAWGETFATFNDDGAVNLYYDGAAKISTTATGVTVTGTAVTDGLTVAGNLSVDGGTIKLDGNYPVGTGNVALGDTALDSVEAGGGYNVAIGSGAGTAITSGNANTFHGYSAGAATTISSDNTAIGAAALATNILASSNTAVGKNALYTHNVGSAATTYNTAVGHHAGLAVTTGAENTIVGGLAGDALTDADFNTVVGTAALSSDTLGSRSTALGYGTLNSQNFTSATDSYNTAVGHSAGNSITTGIKNTLIGGLAGDALTDADFNVAVGFEALGADTLGTGSVAIGRAALEVQNFTTATTTYNVAVGHHAGLSVTTGTGNALMGGLVGTALTDADNNTAVGYLALTSDTLGDGSTALGNRSLKTQNFSTAATSFNTAVGFQSGEFTTTGQSNVFVGYNCGQYNSTGYANTFVGSAAGTGVTGAKLTGNSNTAIGQAAGEDLQGGASDNTFLGANAGGQVTTGSHNILIGHDAGTHDTPITTGANNIIIGNFSDVPSATGDDAIVMGYNVTGVGADNFTFGRGENDSNIAFGATSITAPSDQRYKEEISDSTAGLAFIKDLRPVTFKWKKEKDLPTSHRAYVEGSETRVMNDYTNHGFIAQEVKTAIDSHPELKDGFDMWSEQGADGRQRLGPSSLIPMLVKALQELSAKNDALEVRLAALEG